MPIKKAAEKALRQTKKRTERNKMIKDAIAFSRRSFRKALESKDVKKAAELAKELARAVDKAVQNKVMKKNTGGRIKSRLMQALHRAKAK